MNWNSIAPETRLYKGKDLFQWHHTPGLEHHCGVCQKPLNNPRAKSSCLGNHVEPCHRFHQQLHFVGKAHECFGCCNADEQHHTRHKEILKTIRKLSDLDGSNKLSPLAYGPPGGQFRRRSDLSVTTDTSSDCGEDGPKLKRSERKKMKKAGLLANNKRTGFEAFPREDTDFVSEAIHLTVIESRGAWEGTYAYNKQLPEIKTDMKANEDVDPLSVKSPAPVKLTRRTMRRFDSPINHSSFRGGSKKFVASTAADVYDGIDPQIFFRLGVEVANPPDDSVARRELVARLVAVIKDDLAIVAREQEESAMREEGFWRWAGKGAYQAIKHNRAEFDWATGQKRGAAFLSSFEEDDFNETSAGEEIATVTPPLADQTPTKATTVINSAVIEDTKTPGPAKRRALFIEKPKAVLRRAVGSNTLPPAKSPWGIIQPATDKNSGHPISTIERDKIPWDDPAVALPSAFVDEPKPQQPALPLNSRVIDDWKDNDDSWTVVRRR